MTIGSGNTGLTGVAGGKAQQESIQGSGSQEEKITNTDNSSKEFCCKGELTSGVKAKGRVVG